MVLFLSILAIGLIATSRLPVEMYPKGQEGHSMEIRTGWSSGVAQESMEKLGLPMEKTFTNLHKYGNTAGASVPIAMREAMDEGLIVPGSLVVTAAFGGGLALLETLEIYFSYILIRKDKVVKEGDRVQLYVNPVNFEEVEYKRGLIQKVLLACVSLFCGFFLISFLLTLCV